ncbi:MAG TPA: iron chelate uptake ABC transporter family permease subunit, partial [Pseudorhizobium sp.]|nr:iron chelate uptake ABC transporter family permease subunit [Pseudorhizobium sp.]
MKVLSLPFRMAKSEGDRSVQGAVVLCGLVVLLLPASLVALGSGPTGVGLRELWLYATGNATNLAVQDLVVLEAVRLPRTALGILVGAGLAVSGAMMQGLFRNPLADPGIVGVTSGAALAAVIAIVLGPTLLSPLAILLGNQFLPLMAFCGALLNTWVLYLIATQDGRTSTTALILSGIAIGALSAAVMG